MNKRLIFILLFFFALFTPLVFNSPSKIYEVFAGGPIAPTPFGPGPVVPPGGVGSGGTGTTIPIQTPVAGKAFNGWNGSSFDTVTMPTPAPTPTPVPASTPIAGQAVTGFGVGVSSVTRESFQAPIPTPTPVAGKAFTSWNGSSFTTMDVQTPLPTATPTANAFVTDWDGSAFNVRQPIKADISDFNESDYVSSSDTSYTQIGAPPFDGSTLLQDSTVASGKLDFIPVISGTDNTNITGKQLFGELGVGSSITASIPTTCFVGEQWVDTTTSAHCDCVATDTWDCKYVAALPGKVGGTTKTADVQSIDCTSGCADDSSTSTAYKFKVDWTAAPASSGSVAGTMASADYTMLHTGRCEIPNVPMGLNNWMDFCKQSYGYTITGVEAFASTTTSTTDCPTKPVLMLCNGKDSASGSCTSHIIADTSNILTPAAAGTAVSSLDGTNKVVAANTPITVKIQTAPDATCYRIRLEVTFTR